MHIISQARKLIFAERITFKQVKYQKQRNGLNHRVEKKDYNAYSLIYIDQIFEEIILLTSFQLHGHTTTDIPPQTYVPSF